MTISDICKAAGWQVGPNNIHRLPGVEFEPVGPGAWMPADYTQSIRYVEGKFLILERHHEPVPDVPFHQLRFWHVTIAEFTALADVLAWLQAHGKQSEGGQPAGSCGVWD